MKKIVFIQIILWVTAVFAESLEKDSLFNLKSQWKNQNNQITQMKDFSGSTTILAMVYTGCSHTCPMTISKIQEILKKSKINKIKIVLASFDTERDRPKILKEYLSSRHLSENQWTFITADKDSTVRELAIILGVNYKDVGDGEFAHSNILTLLNSDGIIKSRLVGLQSDDTAFVKALNEKEN